MSFAEKSNRPSETPTAVEARRRTAEHACHELRLEGHYRDEFGEAINARIVAGDIEDVEARQLLIGRRVR